MPATILRPSDTPDNRHIETLAFHTQRLGLQGRVAGSHLTSMHSMDNYYVSKLLPLMREAGVHAVANPLINITLQGRHDTYPKRRGMTRVPELMDGGVTVGFGHDCVMDPWYSLGSADMLEVAAMGLHVAQMTSQAQMRQCFDAVTVNSARILGLADYGLEVGKAAEFVLLPGDPNRAAYIAGTFDTKGRELFYLRQCLEKLGLRTTADLIRYAVDHRITG